MFVVTGPRLWLYWSHLVGIGFHRGSLSWSTFDVLFFRKHAFCSSLSFPLLPITDHGSAPAAGEPYRNALIHLQAEHCGWLTGGALWDEDLLLQRRYPGGHEHVA